MINGGAINYDLYKPIGLLSNTYVSNYATYGKNYASYPFYLNFIANDSYVFSEVASGNLLSESVKVGVFDQDG